MFRKDLSNKRKNLYSKFKFWCACRRIPLLMFPVLSLVVIGVFVVLIGGTLAGWNIGEALNSKTAYLIYGILTILFAWVLYALLDRNSKR